MKDTYAYILTKNELKKVMRAIIKEAFQWNDIYAWYECAHCLRSESSVHKPSCPVLLAERFLQELKVAETKNIEEANYGH